MVIRSSSSLSSFSSSSSSSRAVSSSAARQRRAGAETRSPSSSAQTRTVPVQRWQIAPAHTELAEAIAQATDLSPLLAQVLINRGITTPAMAQLFLNPDAMDLPSPLEDFADLTPAVDALMGAITQQQKIAICGDYDADGMTSTALLIRALRSLGAMVDYAIPSRMSEGYGINERIVDDFHREGVRIILTVDNGIAAIAPVTHAVELGMMVIITDHHDVPETLPPAQAILNPKLIPETSPYRGLAGVGVAYILALELAQRWHSQWHAQSLQSADNFHPSETPSPGLSPDDLRLVLLDLFTLGTIADLAPLTGVNRRWVQQGLRHLPQSTIPGVKALIQVAGLADKTKGLKPEAIGFRLGPRINAVGRIANPVTVIELLTTDDLRVALERAMECEQVNQERRRLCTVIEQEAIAHIQRTRPNLQDERVLVLVQPGWHHGVIGIVASRLVERYGVPVFIGTYENDDQSVIRGSARSIPEFNIHHALVFCDDSLEKYGGHQAAGGFTLAAGQLSAFRQRLQLFAHMYLRLGHLRPLVTVDVAAQFDALTHGLYSQIDRLHPCGIGNPDPVFWTAGVRVVEQKTVGKEQDHLKLTLQQPAFQTASDRSDMNSDMKNGTDRSDGAGGDGLTVGAIAWRWGRYYPLPPTLDIAYQLKINEWQGQQTIQLELVGLRISSTAAPSTAAPLPAEAPLPTGSGASMGTDARSDAGVDQEAVAETRSPQALAAQPPSAGLLTQPSRPIVFTYRQRQYGCSIGQLGDQLELRIRNAEGKVLALQPHSHRALMGTRRDNAVEVDMTQPHYFHLIKAALNALEGMADV